MNHLLLASLLLASVEMQATTYYISPSGNDNNAGTSQAQAWQTISRLNQSAYSFAPGDQILFARGGKYRGEMIIGSSGNSSSQITYGAYGTGSDPVISGSTVLNSWTVHQGNIWKTNTGQAPKYVFCNDQLMQIARFPNTGWLRNNSGTASMIQDEDLTQASGYWVGAEAVIRSTNWSYEVSGITSSINGQINFNPIVYSVEDYEWGYFLRNKLSELDMPGEWFYDSATGDLYLQAPGNGNPNNMTVEAAVTARGIHIHPNRHHVTVDGLHIQHQTMAGVLLETANNITVQNCHFSDLNHAIESFGHHNTFDGNTIERTFETAIHLVDDNSSMINNNLSDIAMEPGLGENDWGYFGARISGDNNTVSGNRLNTIGYIGINLDGSALVEHNYVDNALALLNDGCAIGFDECDGMMVRENIMVNVVGNLESAAADSPWYEAFAFGLYFGNLRVENTTIERNTVANCVGAGIHVDHTMLSAGNIIRDNTFFNNTLQMSLSDFSNYSGPGAVAPYYIADYGEIYSGNIMYSLTPEQLCMKHLQVYTANWTDWGTFTNNYYHNPYEKQSMNVFDLNQGSHHRYTIKRWQNDEGEDIGSQESPKNWPTHEVTNVLGSEMASNGEFDNNLNGWSGWPAEGIMTHDYTHLDNGAMKVNFSSNAQSGYFFLSSAQSMALQNGQWYKLEFSVKSNQFGEVHVGVQADSQFGTQDLVFSKYAGFGTTRRDYTFFFQSDRDEPAKIRFTNIFDEPVYWIDNISLQRVEVAPVDPMNAHQFFYNDQNTTQTFTINGCWSDVTGALYTGSVDLAPFRSIVLIKEDPAMCNLSTGVEQITEASPEHWGVFPNPIQAGSLLNIGKDHEKGTVTLMGMQGRMIAQYDVLKGQQRIRLEEGLPVGIYLLRFDEQNERSRISRITVQ